MITSTLIAAADIDLIFNLVSLAAAAITVASLVIALLQTRSANRTKIEVSTQLQEVQHVRQAMDTQLVEIKSIRGAMKTQLDEISNIRREMTTQFLGEFPYFAEHIADLIRRAQTEVFLVFDVPGYALLSAPNHHEAILRAIQDKKAAGVDVSITVYNEQARRDIIEQQARHQGTLESWKKDPAKRQSIQNLLNTYAPGTTVDQLSIDNLGPYVDASEAKHAAIIEHRLGPQLVHQIDMAIPVYYWRIDRREAVIAIPAYGDTSRQSHEPTTEYGFRTSDQKLLRAVEDMLDRIIAASANNRKLA